MRARPPVFTRSSVALAAAALLGSLAATPASAATCTWNTTSGNWNALANWLACVAGNGNPGGTPGSADSASIGAAGVVSVTTPQSIGALANAGSLLIDGVALRMTGGLTGAGSTTLQGGGLLNLEQTQTVGGNATIVFGDAGNNRVGIDGGNQVVTFASGTTIRGGTGSVGLGQLVNGSGNSVVNQGLISSDTGGTITLLQSTFSNAGIFEATGAGSILSLQSAVNNVGGTIRAVAGGTVRQDGVQVSGGTLSTSGGGSYVLSNSGNNVLSAVTLSGGSFMDMAGAVGVARVRDDMTLNGMASINNNSLLNFEGDQTLGGSGSIVFGSTGAGNRVGVDGGNKTLTIASGFTIRGENGSIGQGQLVNGSGNALVNHGVISADVNGGVVTLLGLGGGITNHGTISAQNGGTLQLQSNLTGAAGSQLVAGAGSVIAQQGVTISGIVNTSGSGNLRPNGSGNNFLSGVTLTGNLDMASAQAVERIVNNLVLNGSVAINSNSLLNFEGDQTLSGNGSIVFGNTGSGNRVGVDGGNKTLTVASGITIRGENGSIGQGQLVNGSGNALVNHGSIRADVAGGLVSLLGLGGGITNHGTISAENGGTLQLQSNLTGAAGSQLAAGVGSLILQQGVTISGVINTSGSGNLRPSNSGNNFLSGVTLNGSLDMAGATSVERVVGGLALNGVITVDLNSLLNFEGDQTLSGNGSIVFGATGVGNRVGADGGNKTLTVASGVTIRGRNGTVGLGQLVNGSGNVLVNQGLISSDSGGTISLAQSTFVNQNVLEATGAGSVLSLDTAINNAGATIRGAAGGTVLQNGVGISGGTLSTSGGGSFVLNGSGNNVLGAVTVAGGSFIDMASAAALGRVRDGMTLNGTVNINSSSLLNFEGDQTLAGNGSIVFGDTGGGNRVGVDGGNKTLTIASGVTIRGINGTIGMGQLVNGSGNAVVNNGTVNADGGGTITIQGLGSGLANNGLLRAQNGTLNVSTALSGSGTLQVDVAGILNLADGAKTQGTLTMGAAGAVLNLGTGNLTINTDYTHAGAGVGNAFNRRAGVTGAGLIVAGGNAAQAVTGTAVTNGNTNNATLTMGNLRVGANTFNYEVANTGNSGPTLRGAIQTSVNGGNITDARLGGTGVTPSTYSAGAPGANGGNLAVVFTAANAGVLSPLSGQVLNLRSNFENIADQKLNIVLASGAAAYNAAVGAAAPTPVVLGNQRVGGTGSAQLTVSNTAATGAFSEDLRATFGATTGTATHNGGTIHALVAGGSNNSAMSLGVNTATAGAKTGSVTLNYDTTGTVNGVSNGLALAGANAPQVINVSGNVYQLAAGALQTGPLNFGTLQVGQTVTQNLVVRNTASGAAGFVEDLNVAFGASGNSQITGSGSLSGIGAGTNSTAGNGAMTVTVTGTTAGALNSSIAVNYFSAGAVAGVSNGLGSFAVGSESYGVNGVIQAGANVINQASPLVNNGTLNLGAVRVGAAAPSGFFSVTNAATAAPQAALNAGIAPISGPVAASGSFNLLNPGATNSNSLQATLNTATAGNYTGANAGKATISFVSDANNVGNCAPNCQLTLASQVVDVEGKVYTAAVGASSTAGLNFGIVRVGDTVSARNIVVNNNAAVTALNDTLRANLSGTSGPFGGAGAVGGVAAGASGNLAVTLNTASNGVFSQSGTVNFLSQNADMADISAGGDHAVLIEAQVNALAYAQINLRGGQGSLALVGDTFTLDLGTLTEGTTVTSLLDVANAVSGPADALNGAFDLGAAAGLSLSNWNAFTGLLAGADTDDMGLAYTASGVGLFERVIAFSGTSTNASDPAGVALFRNLVIRANVVADNGGVVPEPGSLALVLAAAAGALLARRRVVVRA